MRRKATVLDEDSHVALGPSLYSADRMLIPSVIAVSSLSDFCLSTYGWGSRGLGDTRKSTGIESGKAASLLVLKAGAMSSSDANKES